MPNTYAAYSAYDSATFSHGMAGRVSDNGGTVSASGNVVTHPDLNTSLNGDPLVAGFINGSTPALAVTDRVTSGGEAVNIYNAASGSSISSASWADVANLYAVVPFGGFLYALDFDHARVVQIDASTYAETGLSYSLPSSFNPNPSTFSAFGQALLVANDGSNDALYGVFIFYDFSVYPPNFADSLIVKFTISGSAITVAGGDFVNNLAPNTVTAVWDNGTSIYTAAVGGGQSDTANSASAIQQIDLTSWPSAPTTLMDGSTYGTDFYDISIDPSGPTYYILSGLYDSSFSTFTPLLQSTPDFSTFTPIDNTAQAGFVWTAQFTPENNRIWYTNGNSILVYNASSTGSKATLAFGSGTTGWNLVSASEPFDYDTLNGFTYVGEDGSLLQRRAASPIASSKQSWAKKARAITKGRPFLTKDEFDLLQRELGAE